MCGGCGGVVISRRCVVIYNKRNKYNDSDIRKLNSLIPLHRLFPGK